MVEGKDHQTIRLLTFSLCQLCGTIIRFIFYKCDLLPNVTHLELQTDEFGQNLAKKANFFVFGLMVFFFYHLLEHHIRFHLGRMTFSSDSHCDLQHISKVLLFRTLAHYMLGRLSLFCPFSFHEKKIIWLHQNSSGRIC